MFLIDRLHIGESHRTQEGYLAVRAKAARAGIYDYLGREIDPKAEHFQADQVVRVYRPAEEVFNRDSVQSFMLKPITNDHPAHPVTATNWRDYAKGVNAGALRDGEYLAFDLVLMDKALIDAVFPSDGKPAKRELSNGYSSEITIGPGTTDDGHPYDAIQRQIRGNHIAVVDKGRAGSECRITDVAACDSIGFDWLERLVRDERTYTDLGDDDKNGRQRRETVDKGTARMANEIIIVDGLQVEVTDAAKAAILKLQGQVVDANTAKAAAETKVGELTAAVATKDGEIAALSKKVEDAAITPAQLEKLVADRSALIDAAKAIDPNVVTDGKSETEIRRAVVQAKLGDACPGDDAGVSGAFAVLSKDAKIDPVRNALAGVPVIVGDAKADYEKGRDQRRHNLQDAWKAPTSQSAAA